MLNAVTWKHLWWFLCNNHESGLQHAKLPAVILRTVSKKRMKNRKANNLSNINRSCDDQWNLNVSLVT